jgi:DNA mismatch repair protein PMS2
LDFAALKHYTSKLSSYDDLTSLTTFGFRGEALSSLCAVSDFHIVTAQADQAPKANKLEFERSGKLKNKQIVAGQRGTTSSAVNLFSTLPVRRRELEKNIKRELAKVVTLLNEYACISTGVRFNVKNTDAKRKTIMLLSTKANATIKENIANVYGAKTLLTLIPLELDLEFEPSATGKRVDRELNEIRVRGHVSRPVVGEGRGTRDRQMYYVNSRPCGIPQVAKAFNEVYKSYNLSQAPFVLADFQMDTNAYDVNVSPDKRTILLHDSAALIESLKNALDKLFQEAEQTVPQSQIVGTKQQAGIRQHFQEAPAPTAPETDREEPEPIQAPNKSRAVTDQEEGTHLAMRGHQASNDKYIHSASQLTEETTASSATQEATVASTDKDASSELSEDNEDAEDAVKRIRAKAAENPQTGDTRPQWRSSEKPNVVQNAFDRMRSTRPPTEVATITVGDKTVTSLVGRSSIKKRDSMTAGHSEGRRESKRRIHTPSKPNIFGQSLKSFAAPGAHDEPSAEEDEYSEDEEGNGDNESEEDEEEEQEEEEGEEGEEGEGGEEDVEMPDASTMVVNTNEISNNQDDVGSVQSVEEEDAEPQSNDDNPDGYDEDYIDETEEKAKEEAKVQALIQKAEEKGGQHNDNHVKRGKYIEKDQQSQRDSTKQLVARINSSISRIQTHMEKLHEGLGSYGQTGITEEEESVRDKTGEERLSLTVSKDDFAKMRVAGQFNLGFVLATRSHEANEQTGPNRDELFIIDQHASDEKYNFERLQAETVVQSQRLVRPKTLDLTAVEEEIIRENQPALEKNGFVIEIDDSGDEPIGRRCKLISLPLSKEVVFDIRDLEELIVLLSEALTSCTVANGSKSDVYVPRPSKVRKMFAMRACRSSIMIGKTLTVRQMEKVVWNMGTIDKPWNCPHGRPTMRHLMSLGSWNEYDEYKDREDITSNNTSDSPWSRFYEWRTREENE